MKKVGGTSILNINISQQYDARYKNEEVHYETFANLADFFGRDMQIHAHEGYFQVHFLDTGQIELQLDGEYYSVAAPLFIFTPPSTPHAFFTENNSDGHVLTVRQELIWPLLDKLYPNHNENFELSAMCISLADMPNVLYTLRQYWFLIQDEYYHQYSGRYEILVYLAKAIFGVMLRSGPIENQINSEKKRELVIYQSFNRLINQHFRNHYPLVFYAKKLGVSESYLTEICHMYSNSSPKKLILAHILRKAKHELLNTSRSINEIAYDLGFKDPPYFARFFKRYTSQSPSDFRKLID